MMGLPRARVVLKYNLLLHIVDMQKSSEIEGSSRVPKANTRPYLEYNASE